MLKWIRQLCLRPRSKRTRKDPREMSVNEVTAGKLGPNEFNVIIEIPMNADPIKYEVDKTSGALFVDRFMMTAMPYPANYGYVPRTIAADNDPVDVLVHTPFPLLPGVVVPCRAVGVLLMEDESGKWVKVIDWSGLGDARAELMSGIRRFQDQLPD